MTPTHQPETLSEYLKAQPKWVRGIVGILCLPVTVVILTFALRTLVTRTAKSFEDIPGFLIVSSLAILGPWLRYLLPKLKWVAWFPTLLIGGLQCLLIAIGKPMSEWWLILTIAPFTVGAPVAALLAFQFWYAPRYGLTNR